MSIFEKSKALEIGLEWGSVVKADRFLSDASAHLTQRLLGARLLENYTQASFWSHSLDKLRQLRQEGSLTPSNIDVLAGVEDSRQKYIEAGAPDPLGILTEMLFVGIDINSKA